MSANGMRRPWVVRVLAACAGILLSSPGVAQAGPDVDASAVRCIVQSARLNFGRLTLRRPQQVAGEGEAVVACQNTSTEVRRVELALTFPTVGPHTALLQSSRGTLAVAFYRDPQRAWRWGDDRNGAAALRIPLELGAGERRELRLPVYALLNSPRDSAAGAYLTHVPVTLTTLPK
jgi:spore coat protein U-like protein